MNAANLTMPTKAPATEFINGVEDPKRRADAIELLRLFEAATGAPAVMWGNSMVGFGWNHYRYPSGREGDQMAVGFSPRKANLALYGLINTDAARLRLAELGKHKTGVGCLYLSALADADPAVLGDLVREGFELMNTGPEGTMVTAQLCARTPSARSR